MELSIVLRSCIIFFCFISGSDVWTDLEITCLHKTNMAGDLKVVLEENIRWIDGEIE